MNRKCRLVSRRSFPGSESTNFYGTDTNLVLPSKARGGEPAPFGFQSVPFVSHREGAGGSSIPKAPCGSLAPARAGSVAVGLFGTPLPGILLLWLKEGM